MREEVKQNIDTLDALVRACLKCMYTIGCFTHSFLSSKQFFAFHLTQENALAFEYTMSTMKMRSVMSA